MKRAESRIKGLKQATQPFCGPRHSGRPRASTPAHVRGCVVGRTNAATGFVGQLTQSYLSSPKPEHTTGGPGRGGAPRAASQAFAEKNGVGRLPVASLSPPLSLLLLQLHLNFAFGNFNSCSTRTATSRRHPRASTAIRSAPPISVYLIEKFIRLSAV